MPTSSKSTRKHREQPPKRTTQPHTRFDPSAIVTNTSTPTQVALLVNNSVASSTAKTYRAALNTLTKFLSAVRNLPSTEIEVTSITQDEFTQFLASLQQQGITSTQTYRAALLKAQQAANITPWAGEKIANTLAKGARGKHIPSDKGVITPQQVCELITLIVGSKDFFVKPCKNCWNSIHTTPTIFNAFLADALKFQWLARLRPGELELLQKTGLVQTYETLNANCTTLPPTSLVVSQLNFTVTRKNGVGRFVISDVAAEHFRKLASYAPETPYLTPRCIDCHIGQTIRKAAEQLNWNPDLVWCAHGIRHSVFTALEQSLRESLDNFVSGICSAVLRGTYMHSLDH